MKWMPLLIVLCASLGVGHARPPKPAPAEAAKRYFTLEQDVVAQDYFTDKGQPSNITLGACTYRVAHRDSSGDYFIGPEGCFRLVNFFSDGRIIQTQGGVWVPNNPNKKPRLFRYVGAPGNADRRAVGPIIYAMMSLEAGRIKKEPGTLKDSAIAQLHVRQDG